MGRGRAKGKKLSMANQDDPGSGEEEKIPTPKKRGRPLKSLKDQIDEDGAKELEDEYNEDTTGMLHKFMKSKTPSENGEKRKKNAEEEDKVGLVKEENGNGTSSSTEEANKSNGFRQNGNRRKSKPRRAAEAVVVCN